MIYKTHETTKYPHTTLNERTNVKYRMKEISLFAMLTVSLLVMIYELSNASGGTVHKLRAHINKHVKNLGSIRHFDLKGSMSQRLLIH